MRNSLNCSNGYPKKRNLTIKEGISKEDVIKDYIRLTSPGRSTTKNANLKTIMNTNTITNTSINIVVDKTTSRNFDKKDYLLTSCNSNNFNKSNARINKSYMNTHMNTLPNGKEYLNGKANADYETVINQLMKKIQSIEDDNTKLRHKLSQTEKEREDYKNLSSNYMEMSKELGEEVIILRNQLDKFFYYKK